MDRHENDTEVLEAEEARDEALEEEPVGEPKPEMDLPTALAALEDANRKIREVNRESAGRRKEIAALKLQMEGLTKDGDGTVQKLVTLQEQLKAANERVRLNELRDRFETVATKARVPFINHTASRDAFMFAQVEIGKLPEDFSDEELLDVIKDTVKSRPYLLNKPTPPNINSEDRGATDQFAGLDMDKIARDFGLKT